MSSEADQIHRLRPRSRPQPGRAAAPTPPDARPPLFTPRFFLMCGFNFVVFLSAFQLLPTAPFRILDVGGGTVAAGLFLGFLTYASAFSAPFTGAIADRIGRRRTLVICSSAIFLMSFAYGDDHDLAAHAGDRLRARPVLVRPAHRRRRLRHRPDARQPPRRRHRLLRHLHDPRRRRRPRGRTLGLPARLALALRLHRHIEFDDGDYCDAVGGISTQYRRGKGSRGCRTRCWSGG